MPRQHKEEILQSIKPVQSNYQYWIWLCDFRENFHEMCFIHFLVDVDLHRLVLESVAQYLPPTNASHHGGEASFNLNHQI
jgi:hypothetical protein